jgi:Flp pilus assembly protein TadG
MQRDWMLKLRHRLHDQVRRLSADTGGMAAVEFVLTLPLMLMIFFGTIQVSTAVAVDRKVSIAARTLSDLISQALATGVSDTDFTNAFGLTTAILSPYANAPLKAIITEVYIAPTTLTATVIWSQATTNATPRARDATVTTLVPAALQVGGTYLIMSEVTYNYQPIVGYDIKLGFASASFALSDSMFTRPRQNACVLYPVIMPPPPCPTS